MRRPAVTRLLLVHLLLIKLHISKGGSRRLGKAVWLGATEQVQAMRLLLLLQLLLPLGPPRGELF